jgi:hypothetical protein
VQTQGLTLGARVANHVANCVTKGVVGLVKLLEVTLKLYLEEVLLVLPAKKYVLL